MNASDFDAMMAQGFNTMEKSVSSGANTQMTRQAVQNVSAFQQMPTAMGYTPDHTVLPVFQRQAEREAQARAAAEAQQAQAAAEAARAAAQFFVLINNEQKGPLTLEQLKGLAIVDVITPDSLVWKQGTPEWTDLKTCLASIQ